MMPINWEHQYKTIHHKCMTLRQFTIDDAPIILSWIKDKTAFRKWSADRYPVYPPKPEDMVAQYESDVIFPFTAIDDEGKVVGHIILRYPDSSKTIIRLGFVIIDDRLRGKGYGKQLEEFARLESLCADCVRADSVEHLRIRPRAYVWRLLYRQCNCRACFQHVLRGGRRHVLR